MISVATACYVRSVSTSGADAGDGDGDKSCIAINMVSSYMHLGTMIDAIGSLVADAKRRVDKLHRTDEPSCNGSSQT